MTQRPEYYIGLMSGTSLDGVDAVLAQFQPDRINILQHASMAYPQRLQQAIVELFTPGDNEISRCQKIAHQRTDLAIEVVNKVCQGVDRRDVVALADHGQTIRHFPNAQPPYTLQIHQGARLAASTGICTVVDFRSRDIADGGQGAPLVPAFHQAFLADAQRHRVIVNIGGIANISLVSPDGEACFGFDTGPGNTLLDSWCQLHTAKDFDAQGQWGASGNVDIDLLAHLLDEPYFRLHPPKSTGREYFNLRWIHHKLQTANFNALGSNHIQASLVALTVRSIKLGIQSACKTVGIPLETALEGIYICGGGAYNTFLIEQLQQEIALPIETTETLGVPPQLMEATAFAWLGKKAIAQQAIDLRQTTGADHANVLGAIYPA